MREFTVIITAKADLTAEATVRCNDVSELEDQVRKIPISQLHWELLAPPTEIGEEIELVDWGEIE